MVDRFQQAALETRLGIPLIYGVDSVHGHGNLLGATVFPHNIGLGATRDPDLVRKAAHITAEETRATGPQWTFAPCICAAREDRWGRTYESFSEDAGLVTQMETAIDGFQGRRGQLDDPDRVLATAKHYAGDGDTEYGTPTGDYKVDQGIAVTSRPDFWKHSLRQYVPAVRKHDVGSVMPSFSSVDWTEDGVGNPLKMHAHKELITDVLKGRMGFDGFVISDWEAIHQIPPDNPDDVGDGGPRVRQRGRRHVHGAQPGHGHAHASPALAHLPVHAGRRGQCGARPHEPDRRRGQPHPRQEVRARAVRASVHPAPQPAQDRVARAPRGRAARGRQVAGAAQEQAAACCR